MSRPSTTATGSATRPRWRSTRLILAMLLLLGAAERIAWDLVRPIGGTAGEAHNVAVALAHGRGFADAYQLGQGATAHLMPTMPLVAGGVYGLFGVDTRLSEALLSGLSIAVALGVFLLLFAAFGRLGVATLPRLLAVAALCLAPTYVAQETADFRVWEGGLAAFLGAAYLLQLARMDAAARIGWRESAVAAAWAALAFFVNPTLGLGCYAAGLVFALRRCTIAQTARLIALSAALLAALLLPWLLRNIAVMGQPIPLRSNAGLELAVANYPGALTAADPRQGFRDRLVAIHPAQSREAYARMQAAGGEVAYAKAMGREASAWMRAHPGEAARLALLHLSEIVVPRPWQFTVFGSGKFGLLRSLLAGAAGLLGLLGLARRLGRREWPWLYPAALIALPVLLYAPFQPVARYTYLIYPICVFAAADLIVALGGRFRRIRIPSRTG